MVSDKQHIANDTLGIVCHSMGFAYGLGMINYFRGKINFGRLYILAPENPYGTPSSLAWTLNPNNGGFTEVWHYGRLTSKGDQIWAIISTRATILTELDVQTKSEFILHISNTSNKFYDFIYVK
jgi:hypothetical protein